jgi:PPOX class probable F420-dependent enzyme
LGIAMTAERTLRRVAHDMSAAERRAFLMEGTRTAKLATSRPSGAPHVAPIWFVLDGDDVIFNTGAETIKGKALRGDGRVAMCVDDEEPPFAFVVIEGVASISEEPGELLRWATAIGGRYMGADRAEEFGRRNGVPGELLVRITPTRIIAKTNISD